MFEKPWIVSDISECYFYHTMDVPGYGVQQGQWDLRGKFNDYVGGLDLRARRVLDIGTASGFLAFCSEEAEAQEVVAFDMDTAARQNLIPFASTKYVTNHSSWIDDQNMFVDRWKRAFWLAHNAKHSKVKVNYGDVYAISPEIGTFDVVIVGAILEHLRDPFAGLASIASRTKDYLVINTATLPSREPIAQFMGRADDPQQNYTWWLWSRGMYDQALRILGFRKIVMTEAMYPFVLNGTMDRRTAIVAKRI